MIRFAFAAAAVLACCLPALAQAPPAAGDQSKPKPQGNSETVAPVRVTSIFTPANGPCRTKDALIKLGERILPPCLEKPAKPRIENPQPDSKPAATH